MAQINVTNLTFGYESSGENVFENISFTIDSDWKLGFIGRNGKGKTTFLKLLKGEYEYRGTISTSVKFDYFPYTVTEAMEERAAADWLWEIKPYCEEWRVIAELDKLGADAGIMYRPFKTLSNGERTKVMLAVLFARDNEFLLIDEPTNHLDAQAAEIVKEYLGTKKGFIMVSHDRDLLDACADHVLVLNRQSIEVQTGNFSSWWENKERADENARAENEKHLREISAMRSAADRSRRWADKNESTKIGFDPVKEPDRCISTRSYIAAKTKKMQSRVKQYERRMERAISEKEGLLNDIEEPAKLKLNPLHFHKDRMVMCRDLTLGYGTYAVVHGLNFEVMQGERIFLHGRNGCGKSTVLKALLNDSSVEIISGELSVASGLKISYAGQSTEHLKGSIDKFIEQNGLDRMLFMTVLRQLDFERHNLTGKLEELSEGQRKKIQLAASLITPAHLYIWDEPLNYIDVFSRMQIEELILKFKPTMILVDHDTRFREKVATETKIL